QKVQLGIGSIAAKTAGRSRRLNIRAWRLQFRGSYPIAFGQRTFADPSTDTCRCSRWRSADANRSKFRVPSPEPRFYRLEGNARANTGRLGPLPEKGLCHN